METVWKLISRYRPAVALCVLSLSLLLLSTDERLVFCIYFFTVPLYFFLKKATLSEGSIFGVLYGSLFAAWYFSWLLRLESPLLYVVSILLIAGLYSLCFSLFAATYRRTKSAFLAAIAFGGGYVALREIAYYLPSVSYIRSFLTIGYPATIFDWMLPIFGMSSVDFIVITLGLMIGFLSHHRTKKFLVVLLTIFVVINAFVTNYTQSRKSSSPHKSIKIGVIQGNFNWSWYERVQRTPEMIEYFDREISHLGKKGANIIILPEYAIPVDLLHETPRFGERLTELSKKYNVVIVVGTLEKVSRQPKDLTRWIGYDTALVFDPKSILLEPYRAQYPISTNVLHGTKPVIFQTAHGTFPVLSCFEVFFEKLIDSYAQKLTGKRLVLAIANDELFDHTWAPDQLTRYIRRLAITRKSVVVYVSNTGPTVAFSKNGEETLNLPHHQRKSHILNVSR